MPVAQGGRWGTSLWWVLPGSGTRQSPGGRIPHVPQLRSGKAELSRSPQDPMTLPKPLSTLPPPAPGAPPARPGHGRGFSTADSGPAARPTASRPGVPGHRVGSPLLRGIPTAPGVLLSSASLPLTPAAAFISHPAPPGMLAQQIPPCLCSAKWERPRVGPRPNRGRNGTDSVSTRYGERCGGSTAITAAVGPSSRCHLPLQGQGHKERSATDAIRAHPMF